ncbi:MAG: alpha/beta hydrolase [Rhodospirillales bacterium]|nr:alpha/beta hydrolase [Rhodospirillales bacterium]
MSWGLRLLNAATGLGGLTVTRAVPFGADPRRRLDLYAPQGAQGLPAILFFYGGSWQSGERAEYRFVAASLARLGAVVAVADYRLYPPARFADFMADAAAAAGWMRDHAEACGADPARIFVMGHSAGAHIALMLALDPAWLGAARGTLAGAIGLAGPYDFLPIRDPAIQAVFAASPPEASQPIAFARHAASGPALLLLAGQPDRMVFARNSARLAALAARHGGRVRLRLFPALGHIGAVLACSRIFAGLAPVRQEIAAFIGAGA